MKKTHQFWTLLKFHLSVNPFIWFMMIAFGAQPLFFYTTSNSTGYHPNLPSLLIVQNLFMVYLLGLWVLAPDMAQSWGRNATSWTAGTEFLLTRAIDRAFLYRSRAVLLYFVVLLIPMLGLLYSLKNPDLKVTEYSKPAQQQCLNHVPGSVLEPNPSGSRSPLISIPSGNVLIEKWFFWLFAISALGIQVLLLLLHPLKHRLLIFYAIFILSVFAEVYIDFHDTRGKTLPHMERLFFSFAAHQAAFWILTAIALILAQLWCERHFARLEQ